MAKPSMRNTKYAELRAEAVMPVGPKEEARIERIYVHDLEQEEIRLSWWKNGRMMNRPLDLPEKDLAQLLGLGVLKGVLLAAGSPKAKKKRVAGR